MLFLFMFLTFLRLFFSYLGSMLKTLLDLKNQNINFSVILYFKKHNKQTNKKNQLQIYTFLMNLELYLLFIGFYLTCFLVFLDFSCLQSTWEPVEIKYKKQLNYAKLLRGLYESGIFLFVL